MWLQDSWPPCWHACSVVSVLNASTGHQVCSKCPLFPVLQEPRRAPHDLQIASRLCAGYTTEQIRWTSFSVWDIPSTVPILTHDASPRNIRMAYAGVWRRMYRNHLRPTLQFHLPYGCRAVPETKPQSMSGLVVWPLPNFVAGCSPCGSCRFPVVWTSVTLSIASPALHGRPRSGHCQMTVRRSLAASKPLASRRGRLPSAMISIP